MKIQVTFTDEAGACLSNSVTLGPEQRHSVHHIASMVDHLGNKMAHEWIEQRCENLRSMFCPSVGGAARRG
jgi:hypothetical protein